MHCKRSAVAPVNIADAHVCAQVKLPHSSASGRSMQHKDVHALIVNLSFITRMASCAYRGQQASVASHAVMSTGVSEVLMKSTIVNLQFRFQLHR